MLSFFIAVFVVGSVSITLSCIVVFLIIYPLQSSLSFVNLSPSSRLILYLHTTLILQDFASFPLIYSGIPPICEMMGFFHVYAGFANSIIMGLLAITYRYFVLEDNIKIMEKINKYCEYIIFIPPLFALLPFSTPGSYGTANNSSVENNSYCTLHGSAWNLSVNYGVVWAILLPSVLLVSHTIFEVYRTNAALANSLLSRIGLYYLITLVSWIPRTVSTAIEISGNRTNSGYSATHITVYISGILYFAVFISERQSLALFEEFFKAANETNMSSGSLGSVVILEDTLSVLNRPSNLQLSSFSSGDLSGNAASLSFRESFGGANSP